MRHDIFQRCNPGTEIAEGEVLSLIRRFSTFDCPPQITPSPTYFPSTFPVLHDLSYSGAKKDLRGLIRQAESRPTRYAFNQDGTDRAGKKNEIPFPTVRKASLKHYGPCGFLSTMVVWQMGVENVEEIEVGSCGQVPMDNKSWNRMVSRL